MQAAKRHTIPAWAQTFPCDVLRADLSVDELEEIAGRLQAQASTVRAMSPTESLEFFYRLLQRHPDRSKFQLLQDTYVRTGKTVADGTMVC